MAQLLSVRPREFMTPSTQKIQRVSAITVVCYFVAFTAICWFLDLAFPGKLATQTRVRVAFDAGVVSGLLTIFFRLFYGVRTVGLRFLVWSLVCFGQFGFFCRDFEL